MKRGLSRTRTPSPKSAATDEVELSWTTQDFKKSPEMIDLVKRMTLQKVATITMGKIDGLGVDIEQMLGGGGGPPFGGTGTPPGPPTPNLNQAGRPRPIRCRRPARACPSRRHPRAVGVPGCLRAVSLSLPPGPVAGLPMVPGLPPGMVPLPGQR